LTIGRVTIVLLAVVASLAVATARADADVTHTCHKSDPADPVFTSYAAETVSGPILSCRAARRVYAAASAHRRKPYHLRVRGQTWVRLVRNEGDSISSWVYAREPKLSQRVIITVIR
jgi:hypothetical protein